MNTPFVPDPSCNCLACQLARYRQAHPPTPLAPHTKPSTPSRALAPAANPNLPLPWQLAVDACLKLGMLKRSAEQLASALALQYPNATEGEAIRLMFSRN